MKSHSHNRGDPVGIDPDLASTRASLTRASEVSSSRGSAAEASYSGTAHAVGRGLPELARDSEFAVDGTSVRARSLLSGADLEGSVVFTQWIFRVNQV